MLVFNTDNATDMEAIKDQFFRGTATKGLSQKDIERFIEQRRNYGQVYGFNAEDYKASGRRDFGRAMLRSNAKGFGDTSQFEVRDGIHTKDEGSISLRVQGLNFSEETETSRDTLVSDMEAVAETAKNEGKNFGMLLKDGTLAIEVNNKIVFADENFEDPSSYAVLVFDAENATDMELSKYIYLRGRNYNELTKFDINRKILTEGNKFGTYGYNARDYNTSRKEFAGRAMLKSYTKGFGDVSQLIVRGGVYTKNERGVSRSVQGLNFSEETETSRNTLVSDMEAVAETAKNEGKNPGMLLKDGTFTIEVNNKIVFADDIFEDPSYYAVLVFDTDNAEDVKMFKWFYLGGVDIEKLTRDDINKIIMSEGRKYGTYGYNAGSYKASSKDYSVRPTLKSGIKGFEDISRLIVRGGVYTKNERSVSRSVQGLNFSEETDENTKAVRNERTLRKQVERLKTLVKLQGNITHGSVFTDASVGKQVTELLAKYNIKQNANSKVKEALHKFYAFISTAKEFDWNGIQREAGKVAAILLENERLNVGDFFIFM